MTVEVGDSDYSQPAYLAANRAHEHLISLVRWRGNRTLYRQNERSASQTGGAPGHYGAPFNLKNPASWHGPDAESQLPFTSRRGRAYQVVIRAWHNILMPGKNKPTRLRMSNYPFTLVRIMLLDESGQSRFKHPLWLLVVGERRYELSLEDL